MLHSLSYLPFIRVAAASVCAAALALAASGCSESQETVRSAPSEERFKEAMAAFNDEDYETARKLLEAIVLQDPAGEYADDAQFYLAESYYLDEEYHLAAYAYNRLRSFPSSPFYKLAVFKTGESYFHTSAKYDRDQKETLAAIEHFRSFISAFRGDSLATLAEARVHELRNKLAQKDFETGQVYLKLDDPTAAVVYFGKVVAEFPDTDFLAPAISGKLRSLCALERAGEARAFADSVLLAMPASPAAVPAREFTNGGCR